MKILISNDDGYQAAGIQTLIDELKKIADYNLTLKSLSNTNLFVSDNTY